MNRDEKITLLGIETSCDETAVAVLEIRNSKLEIRNNIVSSQVKIHAQYGGIVPEVAARKHAENIISVLKAALNPKSEVCYGKTTPRRVNRKQIQNSRFEILNSFKAIAVTNGPGLITSLLVGVETAKTLAFLLKKPLIPVNHLAAHIYANWLTPIRSNLKSEIHCDQATSQSVNLKQIFPAVCLVVSGGHTELILMKDFEKFKKIGQTLDDAAGECFDKVAKILGLGYPGGPAIAAEAAKIQNSKSEITLPRPMINSSDFNFSFSGLKTAVLYKTRELGDSQTRKFIPIICNEVQQAIIDVLIEKTLRAAQKYKAKSIVLGGGVAANNELRKQFQLKIKNCKLKMDFLVPPKNLCTDNAAMIAAAGYFKLKKTPKKDWRKKFDWRKIKVNPNLEV